MSTPIEELQSNLQSDVEDEVERDLESKLQGELESINEKLNTTTITLSGATSNHNYEKTAGKEPVLSLMIPNSLFSLWKQRREIEERLMEDKSTLIELANTSLNKIIKLNTSASDLETRLKNELSRFQANYRKAAGRRRYKILSKVTNIMLLKDEVVPNEQSPPTRASDTTAPVTNSDASMRSSEETATLETHGKDYDELSDRHKQRRRKEIKDNVNNFLNGIQGIGLEPVSLHLKTNNDDQFSVKLGLEDEPCQTTCNHDDVIPSLLHLLLKYGVSNECYHEMTMLVPELPRSYKVTAFKKDMELPTITKMLVNEIEVAYFNFKEILTIKIARMIEDNPDKHFNLFTIRLSGDGAKYSHTSHFVLFSFTILTGDQSKDLSSHNSNTFAVIRFKEEYETLAVGFDDCFQQINAVIEDGVIEINKKTYELNFFMCCDYKFTLLMLGLNGANSNFACAWCKVHKKNRYQVKKGTSHEKRTLEGLKTGTEPGSIHPPLLNLALDKIIPDELHLLLRITDRLIENLINGAVQNDSPRSKPLEGDMVKELVKQIRSCGVPFYVYETSSKYDCNNLTGTDRKKLLQHLPEKLETCQPPHYASKVKQLWKDFRDLYSKITSYVPIPPSVDFQKNARDWVNNFLALGSYCDGYQKKCVTPYMHILVFHVPDFMKANGNIKQFSCQATEKNNDDAKKMYFRHSNKWSAAEDILSYQYKLDALHHLSRKRRHYRKKDEDYWHTDIRAKRART